MFDSSLPGPGELAGVSDAVLARAVTGWAAASAAADARKLAAAAEVARRAATGQLGKRRAIDDVDAAAATLSCALTVSHGKAVKLIDLAVTLRDRLPKTGARFLAGQISAAMISTIAWRTLLVKQPALAHIDHEIAVRAPGWGPLSHAKLDQAIDTWIDRYDPDAVRRTRDAVRGRYMTVGSRTDEADGTVSVHGRLTASDAAVMAQRLQVMITSVCEDDPRTLDQRSADATGALSAGSIHLACRCDNPDCAAKIDDGRASSIVIHVIAEQDSLGATPDPLMDGDTTGTTDKVGTKVEAPAPVAAEAEAPTPADAEAQAPRPADAEAQAPKPAAAKEPAAPRRRKAGVIPGFSGAIVPAPLLAELVARGAKVRFLVAPETAAEDRYRPSAALQRFVRTRDMTCRFPGCDRPAEYADIDHTVPWPAGATHPANTKCYCRTHHLIKTFLPGWSDRQYRDGTVIITTAAGLSYTTKPFSTLLFPRWNTATPPAPPPRTAPSSASSPAAHPGRHLMMPTRRRTRAQNRAAYIDAERRLNAVERERDRERERNLDREPDPQPATEPETVDYGRPPDYGHPPDYRHPPDYGDDPPPF